PYRAEDEADAWDLGRVLSHLAEYVVVRRADRSGTISLYNRSRYVGTALAGRGGCVTLDPVEVEGVYGGREGGFSRRQKAEALTAERIVGADVSRHRKRTRPRRPNRVSGFSAKPPERGQRRDPSHPAVGRTMRRPRRRRTRGLAMRPVPSRPLPRGR